MNIKVLEAALRAAGYVTGVAGALLTARAGADGTARRIGFVLLILMFAAFLAAMSLRVADQWLSVQRRVRGVRIRSSEQRRDGEQGRQSR